MSPWYKPHWRYHTIDGVPLCAVDASCPIGTPDIFGLCQPGNVQPTCPDDTTLDSGICTAPSTCLPGTTLNPNNFLCELTEQPPQPAIGGTIIPIDTTSLLLAGTQSTTWLIPVVLSIIGIGVFVVSRKSENS